MNFWYKNIDLVFMMQSYDLFIYFFCFCFYRKVQIWFFIMQNIIFIEKYILVFCYSKWYEFYKNTDLVFCYAKRYEFYKKWILDSISWFRKKKKQLMHETICKYEILSSNLILDLRLKSWTIKTQELKHMKNPRST